jgi:hypothetical protein
MEVLVDAFQTVPHLPGMFFISEDWIFSLVEGNCMMS